MRRALSVQWQDPKILVDAARAMSGFELMRAICEGKLPHPPICDLLGYRMAEVEPGRVVFEGTGAEQHYNPIGVVHGGFAMTLLDSCMTCAVHTQMPAGAGCTTLEAKVNLVRPITAASGRMRAIGRTLHLGSRIGTAEGRLEDAAGKLYAHGTTTCIVL